jgi:Ca2+-binding EF-hand superfamily protein
MSFAISGMGGAGTAGMVSGASPSMAPQQKMTSLYNKIDTGSTGSITQSQFNQAFQTQNPPAVFKAAGANAVWNALDTKGAGEVSRQDFVNGMKSLMVELRREGSNITAAQTSADATVTLSSLGS